MENSEKIPKRDFQNSWGILRKCPEILGENSKRILKRILRRISGVNSEEDFEEKLQKFWDEYQNDLEKNCRGI